MGWWSLQPLPTLMTSDLRVCEWLWDGVWGAGRVGSAGEQRAPCLGGGGEQLLAQKRERDLSHFISARPCAAPSSYLISAKRSHFLSLGRNGFPFPRRPRGPLWVSSRQGSAPWLSGSGIDELRGKGCQHFVPWERGGQRFVPIVPAPPPWIGRISRRADWGRTRGSRLGCWPRRFSAHPHAMPSSRGSRWPWLGGSCRIQHSGQREKSLDCVPVSGGGEGGFPQVGYKLETKVSRPLTSSGGLL